MRCQQELRSEIERHPKVVCTGFVADTAPWYGAMDVLVLPTHREGFPNVVLEAAASGIPMITTLATGSREAVLPGITGLLVAPGDPEALAESMLELLVDPARQRVMGAAARRWVVERFPQERMHAPFGVPLQGPLLEGVELAASARIKDAAVVAD